MKIKGKLFQITKMMPIVKKDLLPNPYELKKNPELKLPSLDKLIDTYLCKCTIDPRAERNYKRVNRRYKNQYKNGDEKAVLELREKFPCFYFIPDRWQEKALKEKKPVKEGRKWGDTRIDRTVITSLVDALKEKNISKNKAYGLLDESFLVDCRRIRRLYKQTEKNLTNEPFAKSSLPKDISEGDLVEYTFLFLKPGIRIDFEKEKAIMAQID